MPGREAGRGFLLALGEAAAEGRPLILDGAIGTELDDRGADTSAPLWTGMAALRDAALLARIQEEYADAGADLLVTCTFRTTRRVFAAAGLRDGLWRDAAIAAVGIARRAAERNGALVLGSMGPLGDCYRPDLSPGEAEAEEEHFALASLLADAGVDALFLETFPGAGEALAAARAVARAGGPRGIPFLASLVTRPDGALLSGDPLAGTARALAGCGAVAVGVNCVPPRFVDAALGVLLGEGAAPVAVYANIGRAEPAQGWSGSAYVEPEAYAALAAGWAARGARIIGSCCGSTPAHTRALVWALRR